jgi:hypothetical protein
MNTKLKKSISTLTSLCYYLAIFAQTTPSNPILKLETGIRFSYLYGQTEVKKSNEFPGTVYTLTGFGNVKSGFDIAYFINKPIHRLLTLKLSGGLYLHGRQHPDKTFLHLIPYVSPGFRLKLLNPIYFEADLSGGYLLLNNDWLISDFKKFDFSRYLGLYMPIHKRIGLQAGFQKSFFPYFKDPNGLFGTVHSVFRQSWHVGASIKF